MHYSTTDNWVTVGEPQMYHTALLQDTHWNVYRIRQFQGEAWSSLAPEPGVFFSCFVEEVFQSGGGRANCKAITWLLGPGWAPAIRDRGLPWSALRWTHQQRISRTTSGSSSSSSWRLSVVDLQSYFQNHDFLSLSVAFLSSVNNHNFHIQCEFDMLSLIAAFDWQIWKTHGEICGEWVQGQLIRLSGCLGPAEIMKDITDYNAAAQQQTKLNEKI